MNGRSNVLPSTVVRRLHGRICDGRARTKLHVFERLYIAAHRDFGVGAAVDVIEDDARKTATRERSQIADDYGIVEASKCHRTVIRRAWTSSVNCEEDRDEKAARYRRIAGFGSIERQPGDEAPFHHEWEARVFALNRFFLKRGTYTLDEFRTRSSAWIHSSTARHRITNDG